MEEVFKKKYKRYLASRSSTDLTEYAKRELKRAKLSEMQDENSSKLIPEEKNMNEPENVVSMDFYYTDNVTPEIFFNNVYDYGLINKESSQENFLNQHTLIDQLIEKNVPKIDQASLDCDAGVQDDFLQTFFDCNDEDEMHFSKVKSFKELLESKGFFDKISTPVTCSPSEILLMVLFLCKGLHLQHIGMSKLLSLINSIFEKPILPQSRYKLDQLFNETSDMEFHGVCPKCTAYLGKVEAMGTKTNCKICNQSVDLSSPSCENLFAIIDPSPAIAEILEAHGDYYDTVVSGDTTDENYIRDVHHGKKYREFVNSLPKEDKHRYFTTTFNTDGAAPFKSAPSQLYPMYLMINEIPPQDRFNNLIPCALWFHRKKKPNMMIFLDPFVEIMNRKISKGITCTIKGEQRLVKGYTLICCVDAVARAPIQGIKQFNGQFGCNWCLHPGVWQGSMRYPAYGEGVPDVIEKRSHTITKEYMKQSIEDGYTPIQGIKHPSPFMYLKKFNLIEGFAPDYMHLLAVARQITNLLLRNQDFDIIDSLLLSVKCPHQISRLTRPLDDEKFWKCLDWENWTLYTSTPVMSSILSPTLIKYWTLFVGSLYILLQPEISLADIDKADEMLFEFVFTTQRYFGITAMTSVLHALTHLSTSVLNWGPLWAHSAFAFEAGNHYLLQAVHCARGVNSQILRYINVNRSTSILEKHVLPNASKIVKVYINNTLKCKVKKSTKVSTITYFGKDFVIETKMVDAFKLPSTSKYYKRIIKDNCLYASCLKVNQRTDNSFAQLNDGRFIQIDKFILDFDNQQEYTSCNIVRTIPNKLSNNHPALRKITEIEKDLSLIKTADIKTVCIFVKIDLNSYICPLANLLFY